MTDDLISNASIIERLARLETKVHLRFEELDKSIVLAASNAEKDKVYTRDEIAEHFKVINNFQKRMDKLIESFAEKKYVDDKVDVVNTTVKSLELTRASLDGKASRTSAIIIGALSMAGLFMAIASLIIAILKSQ
jgi:Mg2+ and Co2+ transporter CorA